MLFTLAADEAAAGSSPLAFEWAPAVTTLVVFGVFFFVLARKVWPAILKGLDDRQRKLLEEIEAAERARARADEALAEYERSLAEARKEANDMIARARSDAKAAADAMRSRNEAELTELKLRATREIESAKQAAITELHHESVTLATAIAAKILKREISAGDQRRLVEESIEELAGIGSRRQGGAR
jgi:F-type H+-transporting ATPase subunit b